jgi:hypothetical protein
MPKTILAKIIGLRLASMLDGRASHVVPLLEQPYLSIAHRFVVLIEHAPCNRAHRTHAENDAGGNLVWTNNNRRAETFVLIKGLEKESRRLRIELVLACRDIVERERTVRANFRPAGLVGLPGRNQLHEGIVDDLSRNGIHERATYLKRAA